MPEVPDPGNSRHLKHDSQQRRMKPRGSAILICSNPNNPKKSFSSFWVLARFVMKNIDKHLGLV